MIMGECAVCDHQRLLTDGVCAGSGARVREPLSVLTMPDDSCPLCSAGASIRRALLAVRGEALDWSTRLFSIECSERWARGASERADDEGRDDLAAKLRGCESGLAHGGDAIRALIQTRARLAEVEAERDAARAGVEELRLTLAAEQGKFEGLPFSSPPRLRAAVNAERIRRGLSWREVAAQIGVSSSGFTRWNAGHDLSVSAYLKVCDWLRAAMIAADKVTP